MRLAALLTLILALFAVPCGAVNLPITAQQVTASAAGAASVQTDAAIVTTAALTTAAGATYTLTLASPAITPNSLVMASVGNGTNTAGTPNLASVTAGTASVVIVVQNIHSANSFNGTIELNVIIFN